MLRNYLLLHESRQITSGIVVVPTRLGAQGLSNNEGDERSAVHRVTLQCIILGSTTPRVHALQ